MKKARAFVAAVALFAPCLASAASFTIQAENFAQSYNILPEDIAGATGALTGLDAAGEWAQFQFYTSMFGTYSVAMRCWGTYNVPYKFNLVTIPAGGGSAQTIHLNFTGKGSCGA